MDEQRAIFVVLQALSVSSLDSGSGLPTFSYCSSTVLESSFFKRRTTSSTFLLETMSMAMLRAFLRTSRSGLESTRRISMVRSSRMPSLTRRNWLTFSRTINLTLLSDSLMLSSMNLAAAALTATGLLVSAVSEDAASYTTVDSLASRRSKIRRR